MKYFILNKLKKGTCKNQSNCILIKKSMNHFIFTRDKKNISFSWCGYNYKPKNINLYISFEIKFISKIPKVNSGFYLKTHNKINYYSNWLKLCKKNKFVKICFPIKVSLIKQNIIFISDYYKDHIHFEIKNFKIVNEIDNKSITQSNVFLDKNNNFKDLNIIVRGHVFKKDHVPESTYKKKYNQDFFKLIKFYKKFFLELSKKYNIKVYFVTYDNTPKKYKNLIKENNWNIYTIPFPNSKQFTGTCKFLENNIDNTIIIRSDLIIKDTFINVINKIKFNYITVLSRELKGFYNDTVIFVPKFYVNDFIDNIRSKRNKNEYWGHLYKKQLIIKILDPDFKKGTRLFKKYIEIYRG
jgi:hypothetical protein